MSLLRPFFSVPLRVWTRNVNPAAAASQILLRTAFDSQAHFSATAASTRRAFTSRSYNDALSLLDTLQSNRDVRSLVETSGPDGNQSSIPEMLGWVRRAGLEVDDFNKLRVIHVAGTKGKGSVCAILSSILQQYSEPQGQYQHLPITGLGKIGLFTSPHLVSVRERIRINGELINQNIFTKYFYELWDRLSSSAAKSEHLNPASSGMTLGYFRFLTIMALHVFLQEGVQTVIMECGIGGEYDSTNIFSKEAVTATVITKLGIDHVGMLGNTIESIAWHKSGIMKDKVKCFTVPQVEGAMSVLQKRASEKGAILSIVDRQQELYNGKVRLDLEGDSQKENASLAISTAAAHLERLHHGNVLEDGKLPVPFVRGLESVRSSVGWEGRYDVRREESLSWWIDGAHTIESIQETAKWFATKDPAIAKEQTMLIFNQTTRDASALLRALDLAVYQATGRRHVFGHAAFCTNTPHENDRAAQEIGDLKLQMDSQNAWVDLGYDQETGCESTVFGTVEEAMAYARLLSKDHENFRVLVTGSLYLVGGFLKVLKGDSVSP